MLAGDSALVSSATLPAGSHYIRAVYSGDSNFKSDSSSVTQVVNQSGPGSCPDIESEPLNIWTECKFQGDGGEFNCYSNRQCELL